MAAKKVSFGEAFEFPTHIAGDISTDGRARLTAYRGADIAQSSEGKLARQSAALLSPGLVVRMRDAFSSEAVDSMAARINPLYGNSRDADGKMSWCHYTMIDSRLGELAHFCQEVAADSGPKLSARFVLTPGYANLILYQGVHTVATCIWNPVIGEECYLATILAAEDEPNSEILVTMLRLSAKGFATACNTLAKACPMTVERQTGDPLTGPGDIRNQN